jgi:NTP pyrophosphatase (non-canonical NTP hydrolase)
MISSTDSASDGTGGGGSSCERAPAEELLQLVSSALPSVSVLQHAALEIYGRLEPYRALAWTIEELGELAQVVRRGDGSSRLEEELGQLAAWTLCLANILGVDLAKAVELAINEEIERQLEKYGRLIPYQAAGE